MTFQSSASVSIQSQKPRNPRRAAPISSRTLSENHRYSAGTLLPLSSPSSHHPFDPRCSLCRSGPFDVCRRLFRICTRATPATMGPQNIYFLGPRGSCGRTADLKGAPLNLVRGDNGSDDKRRVLTSELRGLNRVSCVQVASCPARRVHSGFPDDGRSNFLICSGHAHPGVAPPMIFQARPRLPSVSCAPRIYTCLRIHKSIESHEFL